MKPQL